MGTLLRLAAGALILLAMTACEDSAGESASSPTPAPGLLSSLPTDEPPIAGGRPPTIELNTPEPTFTLQPTPTPNPTYTPVPTPTPLPTNTPTPAPPLNVYESGQTIPDFPSGLPNVVRGGAQLRIVGGNVVITMGNGGTVEYSHATYTCVSGEGCGIENGRVTAGTIRVADPSNVENPTPIPTATPRPTATPTPIPEPTHVVLGDCQDGMRLRPGEGCRYTGGGSPQANVVLSVQLDGAICREGGPAKQKIGGITLNMDSLRLCVSGGFERDDAFQSGIVAGANADGSWTFYESALSATRARATPTPRPTARPEPMATPTPDSQGDGRCSAGIVMPEGDYCTVSIPGMNVGTDRFEIRDGSGCYGNICSGNRIHLNDFIASKNSDGSWTVERVPGTIPTAQPRPTATPTPEPTATLPDPTKEPIIFSDLPWESAQLQNRIAQYIIEHGYDYPTGVIFGATSPLLEGLQRGDTDVTMEIWLPNQDEAWDRARSDGAVLSVGRNLGSDWQSAFVIPAYLQQEYPDLDSVDDLKDPQFKELFQTAESGDKARLVSCIIGWVCEEVNAAQIEGYGLSDHVHIVNPVSEAALNADLYGAYERQEPWLGYQWGINDLALKLDLVRLEEPAYSDECWFTNRACAYEDANIIIAVNSDLLHSAPDVVDMLRRWDFNVDVYKTAVRWQDATGVTDPNFTAIWWLESNSAIWSEWVTAEAAANVQAALDRGETAAGWPD